MDRFRLRGGLVVVAFLAVGLPAGCGTTPPAGGTPSAGDTTETPPVDDAGETPPPDDTGDTPSLTTAYNRILEVGDSWTYEERQEATTHGQTTTTAGTHVYEVLPDIVTDPAGNPTQVISATLNGVVNDETEVIKSVWWYFSQDSDGTFYQHSRVNGYVNPPVERFVAWPPGGKYASIVSPITVGATNTWDVVFDDGTRSIGQSTVVAIEKVTVPAGAFLAARIEVSNTETNEDVTYSWDCTVWHVPEIGREVRAEFNLSIGDDADRPDATGHRVRELTETNVIESGADESDLPPLPEGVELTSTDSGLQYYDFEVGAGQQPLITSTVTVDYVGYLEDGTVFDSGEAVQFNLGELIDGFAEGVSTMQEGGRRRLIIPPELGYGPEGNPGAGIGGDDTIVFDVTLVSVDEQGDDTDADGDESGIPRLPEGAELTSTDSGLQYYDFEVGAGQQPLIASTVTVDYVGYLEDGTVFDSGEAVQFNLGELIDGFAEGISTMQEGGRRRLIIPPELGYGPEGNPGAGIGGDDTIVFDVTLISVDELGSE